MRWRVWIGVAAALAAAGILLTLPAPKPSTGRTAPDAPLTLAGVWPKATPITVPAVLPDGDGYSPMLVLDAATTVGYTTSPDRTRTRLVVLTDPTRPRVLQAISPGTGDTIDTVAATADQLYWIRSITDEHGVAHASIWTADRAVGPARQLTADGGAAALRNSQYDLQIADGQLYWAANPVGTPKVTEVRSIAVAGGPVNVQTVPGSYALAGWPWLTSATGNLGGPNELLNLRTGQRLPITAAAEQQLTCTAAWCRVTTYAPTGGELVLQRPDGRDSRRVNDPGQFAALTDVALLDRFEVLTAPVSASSSTIQRLSVYDLTTSRQVIVAPGVTLIGGQGSWLWWSTGDNETLTWHLLDLTTLR